MDSARLPAAKAAAAPDGHRTGRPASLPRACLGGGARGGRLRPGRPPAALPCRPAGRSARCAPASSRFRRLHEPAQARSHRALLPHIAAAAATAPAIEAWTAACATIGASPPLVAKRYNKNVYSIHPLLEPARAAAP